MRNIVVLHIIDDLNVGGAQELVVLLARRMPPGTRAVVCSLQTGQGVKRRLEEAGAEVRVLGRPRPSIVSPIKFMAYFLLSLRDILRLCRRLSPTAIHCHLSDSVLLGVLAAAIARVPKVGITKHTPFMLPKRHKLDPRNILRMAILRVIYRKAGKVMAVSRQTENALRERLSFQPGALELAPNGVAIGPAGGRPRPAGLRESLGLTDTDVVALNVGRLVPVKGQLCLVDAMGRIKDRQPGLKLLIAGDGEMRPRLEERIRELGLLGRVMLLGARDDVADLLAASDMAVISSFSEGTSLALMEAMATSKPILATAIPGNMDVLTHGVNALLVPPKDPDALAAGLEALATDPVLARGLAGAAWRKADESFNIERVAGRYQEFWGLCGENGETPDSVHGAGVA
jgi:glycosyltransferase involved in cell wall biosynthesis